MQVKAKTGFNVSCKVVGIGAALGALSLELEQKKKRAGKVRSGKKIPAFLWEMKGILHRGAAADDAVTIR